MRRVLAVAVLAVALIIGAPAAAAATPAADGPDPRAVAASSDPMPEDQVLALIREFFPGAEANRAIAVARCESSLRTNAVGGPNSNGSYDYGLFQFNDGGTIQEILPRIGYSGTLSEQIEWVLDGRINTQAARELWRQRSWQPWWCAHKLGIMAGGWSFERGPNWDSYDSNGVLITDPDPLPEPAPAPQPEPQPEPPAPSVTLSAGFADLGAIDQELTITVEPARSWIVEVEQYREGAWRPAGTYTTAESGQIGVVVPPGRYRVIVPAQGGAAEARPDQELVLLSTVRD